MIQVMARHLLGLKLLPGSKMTYWPLELQEKNLGEIGQNTDFVNEKVTENDVCKTSAILFRPRWIMHSILEEVYANLHRWRSTWLGRI